MEIDSISITASGPEAPPKISLSPTSKHLHIRMPPSIFPSLFSFIQNQIPGFSNHPVLKGLNETSTFDNAASEGPNLPPPTQRPFRCFLLSESKIPNVKTLAYLTGPGPNNEVRNIITDVKRGKSITNPHSIVVWTGSAVHHDKETKVPRAAIGVFFAHESKFNINETVPKHNDQGKHWSQLYAVYVALQKIRKDLGKDHNEIIIATDGNHVYKGFTEWMYRWKEDGIDKKRKKRKSIDMYLAIDNLITQMEAEGNSISFCKVTSSDNWGAVNLAKFALGIYKGKENRAEPQ